MRFAIARTSASVKSCGSSAASWSSSSATNRPSASRRVTGGSWTGRSSALTNERLQPLGQRGSAPSRVSALNGPCPAQTHRHGTGSQTGGLGVAYGPRTVDCAARRLLASFAGSCPLRPRPGVREMGRSHQEMRLTTCVGIRRSTRR
jgi:hypothetical protein